MEIAKDIYLLIDTEDLVILSIYIVSLRNVLKCYHFNYKVTSSRLYLQKGKVLMITIMFILENEHHCDFVGGSINT